MADKSSPILVAGAGGFIGGWLVKDLLEKGYTDIRAVDIKPLEQWYQSFPQVENLTLDLKLADSADTAVNGMKVVYNLAADMGGMGFIESKYKSLAIFQRK